MSGPHVAPTCLGFLIWIEALYQESMAEFRELFIGKYGAWVSLDEPADLAYRIGIIMTALGHEPLTADAMKGIEMRARENGVDSVAREFDLALQGDR